MRPNFHPPGSLVVFLCLVLLTSFAFAVEKKRKPAEPDSKTKAKSTQKADPKQQAKSSRDKKGEQNKQQLARQKKNADDEKQDKKRSKDVSKLAAKTRESDNRKNTKTAKLEAEKKNEKTKDKSAKREPDKKTGKKEVVAKQAEKAAKTSAKADTKTELAAAKMKSGSKPTKQNAQREAVAQTEESKSSKRTSSTDHTKSLANTHLVKEEKVKELPSVKFTLRPIAKVAPRVELKFSVARAIANSSSDAPPPQDNGPDVIDVIEHNSSETGRLDDVLRSEMKTMQFSGVPSNSRRKMDVGKMDSERIKQIQEALAKKGYYSGEMSGQYDDATIEAMRRFQEIHKVDVTGYATAQSLRLLGLTDW